jgi:hypothetical protein
MFSAFSAYISPPKDLEPFDLSEVVVTRSQRHVAFQGLQINAAAQMCNRDTGV